MASNSMNCSLRMMCALFALLSLLPALHCTADVDYNKEGADIGTVDIKSYKQLPGNKKYKYIAINCDVAVQQTDMYSGHVLLSKNGSEQWNSLFPIPEMEFKSGGSENKDVKFIFIDQMWYALVFHPKSDPSKCLYATKPIFVDVAGKIDQSKLVYPPNPKGDIPPLIDFQTVLYVSYIMAICMFIGTIIVIVIIVMLIKRLCKK
ncbi:hypothetical protein PAPHI01_1407 [Pancytospora philotis]|nr:hypothetical protein PAPHI01_1407 [Pancytospora philotis]